MKELRKGRYIGERALFASRGLSVCGAVFEDGESPLKESRNISLDGCTFGWKYPLWYCIDIRATGCTLTETARSGIWYTHGINMYDCVIDAPKTFRRSSGITLENVSLSNALETMWSCSDVRMKNVRLRGDYFGMNSEGVYAEGLTVDGNYIFDGGKNIEVVGSRLMSKDAFWNCENVTVRDSVIVGEYLGWNSKNVTFVNCTIESNQGLCYMENVRLVNCRLVNTDLAFEYSSVEADVRSTIDSVKNPTSGVIVADGFGEIIHESDRVNTALTKIIVRGEK